jgi:hypothetical protein
MKLTNFLTEKYGTDKLLHFLTGTAVTGIAMNYGITVTLITVIVLIGLSIYKEDKLDDSYDKKDIYACIYGIITALILCIPNILFKLL